MLKKLLSYVGRYKKEAILSPVTILGEVAMEVLIPYVMASIIDDGIRKCNVKHVALMGALMVGMALVSLFFGDRKSVG